MPRSTGTHSFRSLLFLEHPGSQGTHALRSRTNIGSQDIVYQRTCSFSSHDGCNYPFRKTTDFKRKHPSKGMPASTHDFPEQAHFPRPTERSRTCHLSVTAQESLLFSFASHTLNESCHFADAIHSFSSPGKEGLSLLEDETKSYFRSSESPKVAWQAGRVRSEENGSIAFVTGTGTQRG
jgi:hypothetical protein